MATVVITLMRFLVGMVIYVDALLLVKKVSGIGRHREVYHSARHARGMQIFCEACKMRKDPDKFNQNILKNARQHARRLVCTACQAIGYSPRDCTTYACAGSHNTEPHQAGHLKFTNADLARIKKNPQTNISLCCVNCKGKPEEQRGKKRMLKHLSDDRNAMTETENT